MFFFFKQNTAYEMRISDWSSDVCSSDLSAYDRYYGDPRVKPNPSLGVIDQGPFYAVKMVPGDLGTKGGILTDAKARALRPDGSVIEGLFATGNVSAAVMGNTYAGAGATIGPAITFDYIAQNSTADSRGGKEG